MTLEEARKKLIEALEVVSERFHGGSDEWQAALLRAFRQYCMEIEINNGLLLPLEKLRLDTVDTILRTREPAAAGQPKKRLAEALALTFASAAVTVLKERGHFSSITEAERGVAVATEIDRKKIRSFRNSINSGTATEVALRAYPGYVAEVRSWPYIEALPRLSRFLK
jgi:hypothetical protein